MNHTRKKNIAVIGSLLVIFGFAYIMAFFTSTDMVTNSFTVGEVKIQLIEDAFTGQDKNLSYGQILPKDPVVKNIGKNDAIVFLKVTVPMKAVTLVKNENGIESLVNEDKSQNFEMFDFLCSDSNSIHLYGSENNGSTGEAYFQYQKDWVMLTAVNHVTYPYTDANTKVYLFGYSQVVEPNQPSKALFDNIRLKNIIETAPASSENIVVEAYGIQAKELEEFKEGDTLNADTLSKIFERILTEMGG